MSRYHLAAMNASALALMLAMPLSHAESPTNVMFAGINGSSRSGYAYLGAITPMQGAELGMGPYGKAVLSWLNYRYNSSELGPVTEIDASGPGLELGGGYAWRDERGTLDLSATVGYRNLHVTPFVPADQKSGSVLTLNPQLAASTRLGSTADADLIANYSIGLGSSWARARIGTKPSGSWRAGVEAIFLDGRNYSIRQQGVFVSMPVDAGTAIEFSVGRSKPRDDNASAYAGIAFVRTF